MVVRVSEDAGSRDGPTGGRMKIKDFLFDVWLAFGVFGMAVGMLAPIVGVFYVLWEAIK